MFLGILYRKCVLEFKRNCLYLWLAAALTYCFVGVLHPLALDEDILTFMFSKHFIKRLMYFVMIIAVGAIITLVVNQIDQRQTLAEEEQL